MSTELEEDAVLHAFARKPAGASTLDLLKRLPSGVEPPALQHVRQEMLLLATAAPKHRHERKPARDITTIGERLGRPKETYVPGTPIARKLEAGRFIRTDGKDVLSTSWSAPSLPVRAPVSGANREDALELAVQLQTQQKQVKPGEATPQEKELTPEMKLTLQRQQLEQQLLHVTRKLCRKYSKQLYPAAPGPLPERMTDWAEKWTHADALSERERYDLYMASRYSTQSQLDFYGRDLAERDGTNNRHRHHTEHTKYSDALAFAKHSLRGKF